MKKIIFIFSMVLFFGVYIALAQKGQPHDPSPQKDPDIQIEYDQHQKENNEKVKKEKKAPKKNDNYEPKVWEATGKEAQPATPEVKMGGEKKMGKEEQMNGIKKEPVLQFFPNPCNSQNKPEWCL